MGFSAADIKKLTFKVQAGNVIDADTLFYWYQSNLANNPTIKSGRIIDQTDFDIITNLSNQPDTFNNQTTGGGVGSTSLLYLTQPGNALANVVKNEWGTSTGA